MTVDRSRHNGYAWFPQETSVHRRPSIALRITLHGRVLQGTVTTRVLRLENLPPPPAHLTKLEIQWKRKVLFLFCFENI